MMRTSTKGESLTRLKDDLELDAYNERLQRKEFWADKAKLLASSIAVCSILFGIFSFSSWLVNHTPDLCTCTVSGPS